MTSASHCNVQWKNHSLTFASMATVGARITHARAETIFLRGRETKMSRDQRLPQVRWENSSHCIHCREFDI